MNKLWSYILDYYPQETFPALAAQMKKWQQKRPLASAKILDATPIFRNTMVKYAVLLAGGADLTISVGKDIPYDPEVLLSAEKFGIRIANAAILQETFDAVADCAGRHSAVKSRCGYAELTRSGLEYYKNCQQPVYSVDSGKLKLFETTFGTGESFVRAMTSIGYKDFHNKTIVIFGGGKVGLGTAFYAAAAGAECTVIDKQRISTPENIKFIHSAEYDAIREIISKAWCVVSATGISGALAEYVPHLLNNDVIIANMGVEDEFGHSMPSNKVLNNKQPLNFILNEPTDISYIEPSMALSNAALADLIKGKIPDGINLPDMETELEIIADIRECGRLNNEIKYILGES